MRETTNTPSPCVPKVEQNIADAYRANLVAAIQKTKAQTAEAVKPPLDNVRELELRKM